MTKDSRLSGKGPELPCCETLSWLQPTCLAPIDEIFENTGGPDICICMKW